MNIFLPMIRLPGGTEALSVVSFLSPGRWIKFTEVKCFWLEIVFLSLQGRIDLDDRVSVSLTGSADFANCWGLSKFRFTSLRSAG